MHIWLYSPWAYKNIFTVSSFIFSQECLSTILGIKHMLLNMATSLVYSLPMLWISPQHPQCPPFLFVFNSWQLLCSLLPQGLCTVCFNHSHFWFSPSYIQFILKVLSELYIFREPFPQRPAPYPHPRPHGLGQALLFYIQNIPWESLTYSLSNRKKAIVYLIT